MFFCSLRTSAVDHISRHPILRWQLIWSAAQDGLKERNASKMECTIQTRVTEDFDHISYDLFY
jgi:hypothetical protein